MYRCPFYKNPALLERPGYVPVFLAWSIGQSTSKVSLEPNLRNFFSRLYFLWYRLKELEEKSKKWESRPEDTHLINCLQDKLSEREEIIKQLVVRLFFIRTYIFWNLLQGSIQCFTHCFTLVVSFCSEIL